MAKVSTEAMVEVGAVIVVAVLAVYLVKQAANAAGAAVQGAGGLLTGNNGITAAATNAAGDPVTAYQGAGIFGTMGAATNAVSGGTLASLGQWIGSSLYDLTHPTPATTTDNTYTPVNGWQAHGAR